MSGSLIPNAKQQFLDANGNPLAGGFVYYYIPSTTTFKNTYQNAALSILNTNPIILDSAGECIAYGVGSYRQIVTDVNGNLIWDQPTLSLISNDASNVIYTPPFTNSVPETVTAKLSQYISVKDFGATGDGTTDDTTALQNAINYCIANQRKLFVNVGTYKISSPLIVGSWSGTFWSYSSIEIEGEKFGFEANTALTKMAQIVPTFNNTFAIGIQNGRGVKISNIYVLGKNIFSPNLNPGTSDLMTNSTYVTAGCRDSRYSPYAGIVVDPFGTSVPSDGGYPGLSSYYVASAAETSSCEFNGLVVNGFVVGICLSPNGITTNASEMSFSNNFIIQNKVGFSIGQTQSRNIWWFGGTNAISLYGFDGNTYGSQTGFAPYIYGCNMSGKYLFNINGRYGQSNFIQGVHAEAFASIGFCGVSQVSARAPVNFVNCDFSFWKYSGIYADLHLLAYTNVKFDNCSFFAGATGFNSPYRFASQTYCDIIFDNCDFGESLYNEFKLGASKTGNTSFVMTEVYFRNSHFDDIGSRTNVDSSQPLSQKIYAISSQYLDKAVMPISSEINFNNDTTGTKYISGGGDGNYQVSLGSIAITVASNGTATFTAPNGNLINTGDLIYTTTSTTVQNGVGTLSVPNLCLGSVSSVVGNAITISGVPQSVASGTYSLNTQWWPRYHSATTGTTNTSTSITSVSNPSAWAIGNKILGSGIVPGTYITNIVGSTFTLSQATTSSAAGVRLYDSNIYSLTGSAV